MNDYLLAVILGVVEGLTEFLPVSSTAHIRLVQAALQGEAALESNFWKMFAVVIQLPAVMAVVVYFRHRLIAFVKSFLAKPSLGHPVVLVAIAFVMTAVPAVLAKKLIKGNLESLWVMGGSLVVGGIVMWVVDVIFGNRKQPPIATEGTVADQALVTESAPPASGVETMKPWQAAWIGLVQVTAALFPGTSRSMATIAAGQIAGLTRTTALEFSFFLSIPIMFAACLKDLKDSLTPGDVAYIGSDLTQQQLIQLAIGGAVSFVVAWAVIAWFMNWVRRRGFVPFAVYRIIIGFAVLAVAWRART